MTQYLRVVPASRLRHLVADGRRLPSDTCAMPREVAPPSSCRAMILTGILPQTCTVGVLLVPNRPEMYPSRGAGISIRDYSGVLLSLNAAGKYLNDSFPHP